MSCYVMLTYVILCHVMLYNVCHVRLYNVCHVMLYNVCHVMLYNMCHVSCQLTLIWLANVTLNDCQPTDSLARRSFVFMLNW